MDSMTSMIKAEIKKQYGSVAKFSEASGIPYGTLGNALAKGVSGTAYNTVVKMCNMLGIQQAHDADIVLFNREFHDFYEKLTELDERGVHTVCSVLNVEHYRCHPDDAEEQKPDTENTYNGIGYIVRQTAQDEKQIRTLVRKVNK